MKRNTHHANYTNRKKSNKKLIISLVAAGLAVMVGAGAMGFAIYKLNRQNRQNELIIENFYQESIFRMSESVSNIEVNMSKLLVSTSDIETAVLLNDTYHHSQTAITALNSLPIDLSERKATDKFLNQLGDWCSTQSKSILNSEDSKEIAVSADVSFESAKQALSAENDKNKNGNSFDEQLEQLFVRTVRLNKAVTKAAESLDGKRLVLPSLTDGLLSGLNLSDTNVKNSTEVPELIYDGPFSDGANQKVYKCLSHREKVNADEAKAKAEKVFDFLELKNIKQVGEITSPEGYAFTAATKDKEIYFNVTKEGGFILSASMPCDNSGKKNNFNRESATEKAVEYAAMCGYEGLSPVWYTEADGFAVVNLTPIENGIVFYPDLVKVKVCMVNGDFKGIEATGYCACHAPRNLSAKISEDAAAKNVSGKLSVKAVRLALVPKDNEEKLCYEFSAEYKGLDYFVYIDAGSGKQVNIMRVIDSEQGAMVM